jgi:hypothetical protein
MPTELPGPQTINCNNLFDSHLITHKLFMCIVIHGLWKGNIFMPYYPVALKYVAYMFILHGAEHPPPSSTYGKKK